MGPPAAGSCVFRLRSPCRAQCAPEGGVLSASTGGEGDASPAWAGSSLHFGAGFDEQGKLIAQAWLVAGEPVVVGAAGMGRRIAARAPRLITHRQNDDGAAHRRARNMWAV